jgi:hypothetical protein
MNSLNHELARALMADRQREAQAWQRAREARRTRPAAKRPQPAGGPQPGWLARLVPWFGVRANPA